MMKKVQVVELVTNLQLPLQMFKLYEDHQALEDTLGHQVHRVRKETKVILDVMVWLGLLESKGHLDMSS